MAEFDYHTFVSRNFIYIPPALQQKIRNTTLSFFGTGLSSVLIEQCVRMGFLKFHLVDGDIIEIHNLNRQAFSFHDVGSFKADVLKSKILSINPHCEVTVSTEYVRNVNEIAPQIRSSDIVINTVDCSKVYFDIIECARRENKLAICPFNPGFGGLVLNYTNTSASPFDIFECSSQINDLEFVMQLFRKYPEIKALEQNGLDLNSSLFVNGFEFFPQMCIGATITCGMVLTVIISYLKNDKIIQMPYIYYLNSLSFKN